MAKKTKVKPKFRTERYDGLPHTDKNSLCVHCDGSWGSCKTPVCDCRCHKMLKKKTCLCGIDPLSCCDGCNCACHIAEWKEHRKKTMKKIRDANRQAKKRDQERFANEGVLVWEKDAYNTLKSAVNDFMRDRMFTLWVKHYNENQFNHLEVNETGTEFVKRIRTTPWGKANA